MSLDEHPPVVDRAGAPMVWVAELGAHVHHLPVAKIHFEGFLCAQPQSRFDERWYDTVLRLHQEGEPRDARVPPARVQPDNYWKAFMTGVRPDEAQAYADWNGRGDGAAYEVPTKEQWLAAYAALRKREAAPLSAFDDLPLTARTRLLLARVENVVRGFRLPDAKWQSAQMLMRFGVMEWVRSGDPGEPPWGGFGETHPNFMTFEDRLRENKPVAMPRAETERYEQFGFRLLRKAARPAAARPSGPPVATEGR